MLPAKVTITSEVLSQELDGEAVILNLRNEQYYVLDDVGTRMWELLRELGDPTAVAHRLLEEFEIDAATVKRDLAKLIDELVAAELLQVE